MSLNLVCLYIQMALWMFLIGVSIGWVWIGWVERRDGGWLGRLSVDTVDVLHLGESLGNGVACLTCPAVSLGLTESVEIDLGVALIDLLE